MHPQCFLYINKLSSVELDVPNEIVLILLEIASLIILSINNEFKLKTRNSVKDDAPHE
mgnify:CR=1 FL=1